MSGQASFSLAVTPASLPPAGKDKDGSDHAGRGEETREEGGSGQRGRVMAGLGLPEQGVPRQEGRTATGEKSSAAVEAEHAPNHELQNNTLL